MTLIARFLERTKKYRDGISDIGPGNVMSDSWVQFRKEELKAVYLIFISLSTLTKSCQDMTKLISAACENLDIIGRYISKEHYDLAGPGGRILPQVWEEVIQPGWSLTMHVRHLSQNIDNFIIPEADCYHHLMGLNQIRQCIRSRKL
jgi:hypothetical protein